AAFFIAIGDSNQGREFRRRSGSVGAVASGAVAQIDVSSIGFSRSRLLWHQAQHPCHLVRVHVKQASGRIEGSSTPFGSPVISGKNDGSLGAPGDKLPITAQLQKTVQR